MDEIRPQIGPQEAFLSTPADIAVFGGSAGGGKSFGLLLEALRHVHVPGYTAVIFRRKHTEVKMEGGLWDDSLEIYPHAQGVPREYNTEWRFPNKATIRFSHLEHEKNRLDWMGAQICMLGFDQIELFTTAQFWYMLSRNRSLCGVRPYIRATCNPDPDSFIAELVAWYINQDSGFAIPERSGKIRYFTRRGDSIEWDNSPAELKARFPDLDVRQDVKSFTFISSSIFDNKILLAKDPGYLGNLRALPLVDRERLLRGNWKIRETAGNVYKPREWMPVVDVAPADIVRVLRYWDRAGTAPKPGSDPAYTAGVRMSIDSKGIMYVENVVRFQGEPGTVERHIRNCAENDGLNCEVYLEQDPGSAGKMDVSYLIRQLGGFSVHAIRAVSNKVIRARPASAQMEAHNIKLVKGTDTNPYPWNRPFVDELANFPDGKYKDQADAFAGAVSMLLAGANPRVRAL